MMFLHRWNIDVLVRGEGAAVREEIHHRRAREGFLPGARGRSNSHGSHDAAMTRIKANRTTTTIRKTTYQPWSPTNWQHMQLWLFVDGADQQSNSDDNKRTKHRIAKQR
jgi:hypothetical protein